MKALHVIPAVADRYGGPSRAVYDMCRALQDRECDPVIATTDADGPGRLPVEWGRPHAYRGVTTIFFPRQWSEAFKYSRPLARWLDQHVGAFDVVHIHAVFSHASVSAGRACSRRRVPYVVRPLGTLDPWSLRQKRLRKRVLWYLGVERLLRKADAIQYTSAEERRLAERSLGLTRGIVIPLGVEVDEALIEALPLPGSFRRHHAVLAERPYVLAMCRLHPKKGLELLLDVFLDLTRREEFRHWRLVVAGDGETRYVATLRRLVERRDGAGRVLFTGWLDGLERAAALRDAALFALLSHQENFGLSVVEALAVGVPVLISSRVNLAQEVGAAGAGWVTPLDRPAAEQALRDALRDEGERTARGAAGHTLVRSRFTWPVVGGELAQLYRDLAHRAPRVLVRS